MYLLERIFALRALIAAAMATGVQDLRASEGDRDVCVSLSVGEAWVAKSTAGVVADAEPLG